MVVFGTNSRKKGSVADVIDALKKFRHGKYLNGLVVREMIEVGRERPPIKQKLLMIGEPKRRKWSKNA